MINAAKKTPSHQAQGHTAPSQTQRGELARRTGAAELGDPVAKTSTACLPVPAPPKSVKFINQFHNKGREQSLDWKRKKKDIRKRALAVAGSMLQKPCSGLGATPAGTRSGRSWSAVTVSTATALMVTVTETGGKPSPGSDGSTAHPLKNRRKNKNKNEREKRREPPKKNEKLMMAAETRCV